MVNAEMKAETKAGLIVALYGEAYTFAKYMLFADQARMNGNPDLAELFERTARVELHEHFAKIAMLVGVVRTDADNLRDAITEESYEIDTLYREVVRDTAAAGDLIVSDRLSKVHKDEVKHREAFKDALLRLEAVPA